MEHFQGWDKHQYLGVKPSWKQCAVTMIKVFYWRKARGWAVWVYSIGSFKNQFSNCDVLIGSLLQVYLKCYCGILSMATAAGRWQTKRVMLSCVVMLSFKFILKWLPNYPYTAASSMSLSTVFHTQEFLFGAGVFIEFWQIFLWATHLSWCLMDWLPICSRLQRELIHLCAVICSGFTWEL